MRLSPASTQEREGASCLNLHRARTRSTEKGVDSESQEGCVQSRIKAVQPGKAHQASVFLILKIVTMTHSLNTPTHGLSLIPILGT